MTSLNKQYPYFAMAGIKTWVADDLPAEISIYEDLTVSTEIPFKIDEFWAKELGTLKLKEIEECNLYIFAYGLDGISERFLNKQAWGLFYSLLLQGQGYTDELITVGGTISNERYLVTSIYDGNAYLKSPKVLPKDVDNRDLLQTKQTLEGLNILYSRSESDIYLRIRKGLDSFLTGIQQGNLGRIQYFVRAIEAILKPEIGKTKRQFAHRCRFLAGNSAEDIYSELFDLRSALVHLNPTKDVLNKKGYPEYEHADVLALRVYQAELIAAHAYRNILSNKRLMDNFESDTTVDSLWNKPERELKAIWGAPIDLDTPLNAYFLENIGLF